MKLKPEIRREKILTEIEENKTVDIIELSGKLQVSEMTMEELPVYLKGNVKRL